MNLKEELATYIKLINNELAKKIDKSNCPERTLNESMEYSLMSSGKRLRPILMIKTYQLFAEDFEKCLPFAMAMEMIHNFSLIHDDLPGIDNDDFRRGRPTNHKKFNEATAILAGDRLLNNAYILISEEMLNSNETEKNKQLKAFKEFAEAVDRMCVGEYVDTEFEGKEISNEYLEYVHINKTGALIRGSVRIGAILAGANEKELEVLTKYAEKIGLAFQIKDDILSEIGDEKTLGKPVGNDKARGKITFVTKYGLEKAQKDLEIVTDEAIESLKEYGNKGEFFRELAIYLRDRDK